MRRVLRRAALVAAAIAAIAAIAACSSPATTSDPSGACVADGRAAGMYPELEALLPDAIDGDGPTTVDSGRSCSAAGLGTYRAHGIAEVRYAGATWSQNPQNATVIAVFTTPAPQPTLDQAWVQEFYEAGARASSKTENITITGPQLGEGGRYWRLETLNDLSLQTVAVWGGNTGGSPGLVHVVIVATEVAPGASRAGHNERVDHAIQAVLDGPAA